MPSQTDLDQGGTNREWVKSFLGPSIGWVWVPWRNPLQNIVIAGTYTLDLSTNLVQVRIAGAVTIILPSAKVPNDPGIGAQPGLGVRASVTVVDIGGFAQANPITIKPVVGENIMGLAQIQITTNYGGFILQPVSALQGWVNAQ